MYAGCINIIISWEKPTKFVASMFKWFCVCVLKCFIHFNHFPSLAAWHHMTCVVERSIKPQSFIHPTKYVTLCDFYLKLQFIEDFLDHVDRFRINIVLNIFNKIILGQIWIFNEIIEISFPIADISCHISFHTNIYFHCI